MPGGTLRLSPTLQELKRRLANVLLRSKLDYTDDLFTIIKFFIDLRWERGWTAARLKQEWRAHLKEYSGSSHLYELYFHFPFCRSRCSYCFTNSRVPTPTDSIERYIEEIHAESRFFAPLFKGIPFQIFAVGGGTPSFMTADQLKRFCGPAFDLFHIKKGGVCSIELNPADTDANKLAVLRKLGFNRVSFGVQSMTPDTLRRVNRRQSFDTVKNAIVGAKAAGFDLVNADVIFGLVDEPLEVFLESFQQVVDIHPTAISVCTLSLTDKYMRATGTTREAYLRYYEKNLVPAFEGVMRIASRAGYETPAHIEPDSGEWDVVDPSSSLADFSCREEGVVTGSMLGMGRGSRSQIFGRQVYERGWASFAPKAPIYQAAALSMKEEMASFILAKLEHGSRLSYSDFQQKFGVRVLDAFSTELKILKAAGQVEFGPESLHYLPLTAPNRMFWAVVFALDSLPRHPIGREVFDGTLKPLLEKELAGLSLGNPALGAKRRRGK